MKKILLLVLMCFTLLSCRDQSVDNTPRVSFTYYPSEPIAGSVVQFKSNCSNISRYEWDFGNGQTSTDANPQMTFDEGEWTVTLMGYTIDNYFDFWEQKIYVSKVKPKAKFSYNNPVYVGKTITFTNESTNASRCEWYCDDALFSKDIDYVTKQFDYGTYTIKLVVYDKDEDKSEYEQTISVKGLKLNIYAYKVESINFKDSDGRYWDDEWNDGPDIFVRFLQGGVNVYETSHFTDIMTNDLPYSENVSIDCHYPFDEIKVKLIDYDTWFNDEMATLYFDPNEYIESRPSYVYWDYDKYKVFLYLKWSLVS